MGDVHPRVVAALEAQLERRRSTLDDGARRVGWKLGFGIAEVDAPRAEPVIGHLTSATLIPTGGLYAAQGKGELRAETELAVEIGDGGTIVGVAVALELVDVARPAGGLQTDACGHGFRVADRQPAGTL